MGSAEGKYGRKRKFTNFPDKLPPSE
jgi:hypothetical protein